MLHSFQGEQDSQKNQTPFIPLFLIGAIIGIVPLIVYMQQIVFDGLAAEIYGYQIQGNLFSYCKSVWFLIFTASAMLWAIVNRRLSPSWYYKPLVVYGFFIVVSTVFAEYKLFAVWGDPLRHEGLFTHLAYMATVYLFINIVTGVRELKTIVLFLFASATLLALIGLFQFFGHDLFAGKLAEWLIVPARIHELMPGIDLKFTDRDPFSIHMAFGNGNFVGSFLAMLFPMTMAFFLLVNNKSRYYFGCLTLLLFFNLLGAKSRAGFLGVAAAFLPLAFFLRHHLKTNLRSMGVLGFCGLLMPFVMDAWTLKIPDSPRFLDSAFRRPMVLKGEASGDFEDIILATDSATIVFAGKKTCLSFKDDQFEICDNDGQRVSHALLPVTNDMLGDQKQMISLINALSAATAQGKTAAEVSTEFRNVSTVSSSIELSLSSSTVPLADVYMVVPQEGKSPGFRIALWPKQKMVKIDRLGTFFFIAFAEGGFKFIDPQGRYVDLKPVKIWGFENSQGFASNRGYIWSRTFPLLRDAVLIGYGPDTFAAHFPNHDYFGKLKVWRNIGTVIEKPHNLYLQIFFNSGLISLLAILALFAAFLRESARLYWSCGFTELTEIAGVAISFAVVGYLVAAIFNDSVVTVAPVFWGLLGLGIAVNRMVIAERAAKKGQKEENEPVSSLQEI